MKKKSWLELAVSNDDAHTPLSAPHGCIATDGMRAHIEHESGVCECGDEKLHASFDRLLEKMSRLPFAFVVNKKYLTDALSGVNPDGTAVVFFVDIKPDGQSPIVLQDPDGERSAIIMPMWISGGENMKPLPRVASEPAKKSPRRKTAKKVQS